MFRNNEKRIKNVEGPIIMKFENISTNLAKGMGFEYVPWFTVTKIVLAIYTTLTLLILFYRSDFINLTVCTVACSIMLDTSKVKRITFRILVLGIFVSLIFDFLWLML